MKKIVLIIAFLAFATSASANTLDSTHGEWNVYTGEKGVCYIASIPAAETGNFKKRGQPYVLISNKAKGDEINVSSGYPYKPKVHVELTIDSKKFRLFSQGENAWARTSADDAAISAAMKNGSKLEVKGLSSKGSYSTDDYTLKGFTAALNRMKELCK